MSESTQVTSRTVTRGSACRQGLGERHRPPRGSRTTPAMSSRSPCGPRDTTAARVPSGEMRRLRTDRPESHAVVIGRARVSSTARSTIHTVAVPALPTPATQR